MSFESRKMMSTNKFLTMLMTLALVAVAAFNAPPAWAAANSVSKQERTSQVPAVRDPLNLAILVQDDLVAGVSNEIKLTREFVRALPGGSRVMIGYLRAGSLQVRQGLTTDLEAAAKALRVPVSSTSAAPYNPYVGVKEALRHFSAPDANRNAILLISDGLDVSRGFDWSSSVDSIDLRRAISEAKKRHVAVYSFYAPSVGLTSVSRTAVNFGQSALNRLANETGGRAFFQGLSFVTFDSYFARLSRQLNESPAGAE